MMKRTGKEIEGDVLRLLRDSVIVTGDGQRAGISGSVYRQGLRPRDSQEEDMIVIFTTASADQFQQGVVTVNIYIPDILNSKTGVSVENGRRCEEVERLTQDAVDALTARRSNYLFGLERAIHTTRDIEINQSFVVAHLQFKYYN